MENIRWKSILIQFLSHRIISQNILHLATSNNSTFTVSRRTRDNTVFATNYKSSFLKNGETCSKKKWIISD